jgi:hypothetical protein
MSETSTTQPAYHERLPFWPEADVVDKTIDGLVPASRVANWEDFDKVVDCCLADDCDFVFRGQQNFRWFLKSTLDRFDAPAIDRDFAHQHLKEFRLAIRGRVPDNSILDFDGDLEGLEDTELWAVGQHHGLATPLIDWTRSPYIALFFSFADEDHPDWVEAKINSSRIVYVLNETFLSDLEPQAKFPRLVEPSKDDHGRLVNQAGLFTIAPYGETLESSILNALTASDIDVDDPKEVAKYLCKVHIPNSAADRRNCLRWLRKMNIHHGSLFPDLIGASGYCNELARELMAKTPPRSTPKAQPKVEPVQVGNELMTTDKVEVTLIPAEASGGRDLVGRIVDSLRASTGLDPSHVVHGLETVANALIGFIKTSSGVDWFVRDAELARLRTFVRRQLVAVNYPPEAVKTAASAAVETAALAFRPEKADPSL